MNHNNNNNNKFEQVISLPCTAEQIHFCAYDNTRLPASNFWFCAMRVDCLPNVLYGIEAVQVVEMEIQNAIKTSENPQKPIVHDYKYNKIHKLIDE
jgi:hypothetical protein